MLQLTPEEGAEPIEAPKPEKMAIGVPGGFNVDEPVHRYEDQWSLAVMPGAMLIPLPCPELPEQVLSSIASIQAHDSAAAQAEVEAWQEKRMVSKYAMDLVQLPCERTIPMDPTQVSVAVACKPCLDAGISSKCDG